MVAGAAHASRRWPPRRRKLAPAILSALAALLSTQTPITSAQEPPADVPATTRCDPVDAELEQLFQDEGAALGSRLTGAWLDDDCNAVLGIAGGDVPPALANHPRVRVVRQRFSQATLDAVMDTVASKLDALFAPAYPYGGGVNVRDNVVDVEIDQSQAPKRSAIESALANELRRGTIRIFYGEKVAQSYTGSLVNAQVNIDDVAEAGGVDRTRTG